ncbi:unnamed protein product [Peniophora sp. CBMAI 1063]|nr:unnamed protein product [Peniophora sp. CBMAI 1063]
MPTILRLIVIVAVPLVVETYFYALCTILTVYVLYRRWVRQEEATSLFMIAVALIMFCLFSTYWIIDVYKLWHAARILPELPDPGISDSVYEAEFGLTTKKLVTSGQLPVVFLMMTLGDIVSLWRAYVISGRPRWVYALAMAFVVVEFGLWILIIVQQALTDLSDHEALVLELVSLSVVAAAQLLCTLLIAYKAWSHWRDIRGVLGFSSTQQSIAMLVVVIETGVAYFVALICYAAVSAARQLPRQYEILDILGACMVPLFAMYPTGVIVLVAARLAILERSIASISSPSILHFAPPSRGRCASRQDSPQRFADSFETRQLDLAATTSDREGDDKHKKFARYMEGQA